MAERRMFTRKITESDAFLDMPSSTQMLYFHLAMNADDDGFVNNPKQIQRMCMASEDDMRILLGKKFIIAFDSGIIVIKHWRMHNYIQSDRYKPTDYTDEKNMLSVKENKAYTIVSDLDTKCIQSVSAGKVSIDKNSKGNTFVPPTVDEIRSYCSDRHNSVDPEMFYDFYQSKGWMVGKNKMKDWKACVRTWEKGRHDSKSDISKGMSGGNDYNSLVMNDLFERMEDEKETFNT